MPTDEIRVGAEIDAHCTKCRMVTNHRIVAMVDGVVKRVICLTCDGQHNYRAPAGQKKTGRVKARRVGKDQKKSRTEQPGVYEKWIEEKAALDPESEVRKYRIADSFTPGEPLDHPTFGIGFVTRVLPPDKIEVMFEREIKTLAMNR